MRQSQIDAAKKSGTVNVEVVADVSDATGKRRAEVGRGNRFENPTVLPVGRGVLVREQS